MIFRILNCIFSPYNVLINFLIKNIIQALHRTTVRMINMFVEINHTHRWKFCKVIYDPEPFYEVNHIKFYLVENGSFIALLIANISFGNLIL